MEKQIIEINGIKMEVDMRHATRIDNFKVGDPVKILSFDDNKVHGGVIVGFEDFKSLPTIVVAYMRNDWSGAEMSFAFINSKSSEKYEIISSDKETLLTVDKASFVSKMDSDISKKELELVDLKQKRSFFLEHFGIYFKQNN